jgi:hypothetical protein
MELFKTTQERLRKGYVPDTNCDDPDRDADVLDFFL